MTESLHDLLTDPLADLHASLTAHLNEENLQQVLGIPVAQLRQCGTGKSLVMLGLLDDLLRMTEIVVAEQWNPLEPSFAAFAVPFLQSAARTFERKGLYQYGPFAEQLHFDAGGFLDCHWNDVHPFGGQHSPTVWSGLKICANAARVFQNDELLTRYEQLAEIMLSALSQRVIHAREADVRHLADFITDSCLHGREQLTAPQSRQLGLPLPPITELDELQILRAELKKREVGLEKRETLLQQEWKRFQKERSEFEAVRQLWEEKIEFAEKCAPIYAEEDSLVLQSDHERRNPSVEITRLHDPSDTGDVRETLQREARETEEQSDHVLIDCDLPEGSTNDFFEEILTDDEHDLLTFSAVEDVEKLAAPFHEEPSGLPLPEELILPEDEDSAVLEAFPEESPTAAISALATSLDVQQTEAALDLFSVALPAVPATYPELLLQLSDANTPEITRRLCIEAVGILKSQASDAVPHLLNLLESDSRDLAKSAAEAIAAIDPTAVNRQAIPFVSYVLDGLQEEQPTAERQKMSNLFAVRADLYRQSDRLPSAMRDYENSLRMEGDSANPNWKLRAETALAIGQHGPSDALHNYQIGEQAMQRGEFAEAVRYFEQAADADAVFPWAKERLAWIWATSPDANIQNAKRALEAAERLQTALDAEHWRLLTTLAAAQIEAGQIDQAIASGRSALELAPPQERGLVQQVLDSLEMFQFVPDELQRRESNIVFLAQDE